MKAYFDFYYSKLPLQSKNNDLWDHLLKLSCKNIGCLKKKNQSPQKLYKSPHLYMKNAYSFIRNLSHNNLLCAHQKLI